jgi:hypothetical protein
MDQLLAQIGRATEPEMARSKGEAPAGATATDSPNGLLDNRARQHSQARPVCPLLSGRRAGLALTLPRSHRPDSKERVDGQGPRAADMKQASGRPLRRERRDATE